MRILIITQDEPFYLSKSLEYFIGLLPNRFKIVGCVVSSVSPFGKQQHFFQKAIQTLNVFGLKFFVYYTIKFFFASFNKGQSLDFILRRNNIPKIILEESINHKKSIEIPRNHEKSLEITRNH